MALKSSPLPWTFERTLRPGDSAIVAGVDEVGRGCWAGPVYAAAAIIPDGLRHPHLTDSKQVPAAQRDELDRFLRAHPEVRWSIGTASVEEIDALNILQATLLAMRRAVAGLALPPDLCLVDGRQKAGLPCAERAIIDGDALCPSIAAASVIAKVARDRHLFELAALYPGYGFENHKGYGTPKHAHALALHGPCLIHRRSFRPVRDCARAPAGDRRADRAIR